jgi:predicted transcriptional regulator
MWYFQEAAIEDYFKPIDKEAEAVMKMQLEGEEKTMKEMMKAMQHQALLEKVEAEKVTTVNKQHNQDQVSSTTPQEAQNRWFHMKLATLGLEMILLQSVVLFLLSFLVCFDQLVRHKGANSLHPTKENKEKNPEFFQ